MSSNLPPSDWPPQQPTFPAHQSRKSGMPTWAWVLIITGGALLVSCCSCVGIFAWMLEDSPDTFVYGGSQTPAEYIQIARDEGLLDDDEKLLFFYSDGLWDVREGFYFVTDRKVVVYREESSPDPATIVPFDEIDEAVLSRDTSFLIDSTITLYLKDDNVVQFPVSSENDGDVRFHKAIEERLSGS